jgi:hypothetical protein
MRHFTLELILVSVLFSTSVAARKSPAEGEGVAREISASSEVASAAASSLVLETKFVAEPSSDAFAKISLDRIDDVQGNVLHLVGNAIDAQRDIERRRAKSAPVHPFLPSVSSGVDYVQVYQRLAESLKQLSTARTHAPFFVDYARLLLTMVRSFSSEDNWSRLTTFMTVPGVGNWGNSSVVDFSGDKYDAIKTKLDLAKDEDYQKKHRLPRSEHFRFFAEEIDKVEREKSGHYEWFVLFSSRLAYATALDHFHPRFGHFPFNTRSTEYGALVAHWRLWTSEGTFRRFQEIVGDDVTVKMRTPLALIQAFPKLIMMPYPFKLSEQDLIQFAPIYPVRDANIVPLSFPFVSEKGNENLIFTPDIFNFHGAQYLAVQRLGYSSFAIQSSNPPTLKQIQQMHAYIKAQHLLYAQAIQRLQEVFSKKSAADFDQYLLYQFLHEDTHGMAARLAALTDPAYLIYTELYESVSYEAAQRFFPSSSGSELKERVMAGELAFKEFVKDALGPKLFEKIRSSERVPVAGVNFSGFGAYTFDLESPRAISVGAMNTGVPIPTVLLSPEIMEMYTVHKEIFYCFFTDMESKEFNPEKAWVIEFRTKTAA